MTLSHLVDYLVCNGLVSVNFNLRDHSSQMRCHGASMFHKKLQHSNCISNSGEFVHVKAITTNIRQDMDSKGTRIKAGDDQSVREGSRSSQKQRAVFAATVSLINTLLVM